MQRPRGQPWPPRALASLPPAVEVAGGLLSVAESAV